MTDISVISDWEYRLRNHGFSEQDIDKTIKALLKIPRKRITDATAKKVLWEMYRTGKDADTIINEQDLWGITDIEELSRIADQVIKDNPKAVADYKGIKYKEIKK